MEHDTESVHPLDLALLIALGALALWGSQALEQWLADRGIARVPWVLILTTVALVLAQVRWFQRLRGLRLLGMLAVTLFLAVIGAHCDFHEFRAIGDERGLLCRILGLIYIITFLSCWTPESPSHGPCSRPPGRDRARCTST